MLFKLPSYVWNVSFLVLLLSFLSLEAAEEGVFSVKGEVPGLSGLSISKSSIRSDGRYLFYSQSNAWGVVDLLDFVTKSASLTSVEASILDLAYVGSNRLVVATTSGVEYFNVAEVFDPELLVDDYERPSSTTTDVDSACIDEQARSYFLEIDGDRDLHFIRVVQGTEQLSQVPWSSVFSNSNDLEPFGMLCAKNNLIVFAVYKFDRDPTPDIDNQNTRDELFIARIPLGASTAAAQSISLESRFPASAASPSLEYKDYDVIETGLDSLKENIVFIFKHKTPDDLNASERKYESLITRLSTADLSQSSGGAIGENLKTVVKHHSGDSSFLSFLIGKHFFIDSINGDENELLDAPATGFISWLENLTNDSLRGDIFFPETDSPSIGSKTTPQYYSPSSDHYVYGLTGSTGVALFSKGPGLYFSEEPAQSSSSIDFSVVSDRRVSYEIRLREDVVSSKGESGGLDYNVGRKLAFGELEAGVESSLQLSISEMAPATEGVLSLVLFARGLTGDSQDLVGRLGFQFEYDLPPEPAKDFRLALGSQSVHVYFAPTRNPGDLAYYDIHFSYDEADLSTLPTSEEEFDSGVFDRTITGVDGREIQSPMRIAVDDFRGKAVIYPIENERTLFVRVQIVDSSAQYSADNPEALSIAPRQTKTLASALGGTQSCSLRAGSRTLGFPGFILLLIFALGFPFIYSTLGKRF